MNHQELKDHLPLYVLGGLDTETAEALARHLAEPCESCTGELQHWREVAGLIPLGVTPAGPSDAIKARLMERVRQDLRGRVIPLRPRRRWAAWVAVPLAAAATVLLIIGGQRYQNVIRVATEQTTRVAEQESRLQTIASLLAQAQQQLASRAMEVQQLSARLDEQRAMVAEKTRAVTQLEAALAEQQTALAEQRRLVNLREQELARVQSAQAGGQTAVAAHEREIAALKADLARQQELATSTEHELRELRASLEPQQAKVEVSARETAQLREALARQRGVIEVLTSPGLRVGYLQHAKLGISSQGHVLWNERKKAWLFYAFDLPQPPPGKEYQVWFMTEKEGPISAGVFTPDQSGTGVVLAAPPAKLFGAIKAAAVTLEPAGGLPKPSGEMYLRGSL